MSPPAPPCLLIVEDDQAFRERLARAMASRGYDIIVASDLGEARMSLDAIPFDAALVDFSLPDGMPDLGNANAYARLGSTVAAVKDGAYDYLVKPVDADEIDASGQRLCPLFASLVSISAFVDTSPPALTPSKHAADSIMCGAATRRSSPEGSAFWLVYFPLSLPG